MASSPYRGSCHACNFEMPRPYFSGYFPPDLLFEPKWRISEMKDLTQSPEEKFQTKHEEKSAEARDSRTRRRRATYKRWQLDVLEDAFEANCYPSTMLKKLLAARLDMENIQVQVWFQNRRARMKKDGSERHLPYARPYPLTWRFDLQNRNSMNGRAMYPYFTRRPGVTPMFSGCKLDRVLCHNHLPHHVRPPRTTTCVTQNVCDATAMKLTFNDNH